VSAYFDYLLGENDSMILNNSHITDQEVALRFAAGMTFSGSSEFKFRVKPLDYYIENAEIKMKNIMIERVK
jgi:hypothetical protein